MAVSTCVNFVENAMFKSLATFTGPLTSSLLDDLSMDSHEVYAR